MQYLWGGDSEEREREGRAVVGGGIREGVGERDGWGLVIWVNNFFLIII